MNDDDSDYEVCLTSSQYNRILSIQKQCDKERDQFKATKASLESTITLLQTQASQAQTLLKSKTLQNDQMSVQCLRLKKLRLVQQEEIRNLKEELLRDKEVHLSQFQVSMRENSEIKERIGGYEENVKDLKAQVLRLRSENMSNGEKVAIKTKEYEVKVGELQNEIDDLRKQLAETQKRAVYFKKKSDELEGDIKREREIPLGLKKEIERLSMINEESTIKYREELEQHSNIKSSLQMQLKIAKEEEEGLLKEKQLKVTKLNQQSIRLSELLIDANKKIEDYINSEQNRQKLNREEKKQEKGGQEKEKFSSKIYQAIEWSKQGVLSQKELKEQISNILTFEKEYQEIIHNNNAKILVLQQQLQILRKANTDLIGKKESPFSQHQNKHDHNNLLSENMILKEQLQKQKEKLQKLSETLESTVKRYNETLIEMQSKVEKETEQCQELSNELEAMRIGLEYEKIENLEGVEEFGRELKRMKEKSSFLDPDQVMKLMVSLFPKLNKV